jgi:hypothetical protein
LIPIYIPVFNNPTYLKNFINQFKKIGVHDFIVVDNNSTYPPMINLLHSLEEKYQIERLKENRGPHYILREIDFYEKLPEHFCLSDPDIEINQDLPSNFMETLLEISHKYQIGKVGFSLEIPKENELRESHVSMDGKLWSTIDWDQQFWKDEVGKTDFGDKIYKATLDTTFALYNKKYFDPEDRYRSLRIAGRFTAKHLGSYKDQLVPKEEQDFYSELTRYSYFAGNLDENSEPVFKMKVHEYTKMIEEIDSLRRNNKILGIRTVEQDKILQSIFNSLSWKLVSSMRNITSFFR